MTPDEEASPTQAQSAQSTFQKKEIERKEEEKDVVSQSHTVNEEGPTTNGNEGGKDGNGSLTKGGKFT